jgi:hypothetical protein
MADFAVFAEAVGRALGWGAGTVILDYNANRHDATATQIEDSALATFLLETAGAPEKAFRWQGTATGMFDELRKVVGKKLTTCPGWPKSPRGFANELRRIASQLRSHGIYVTFEKTPDGRIIFITNLAWRKKIGLV